MTELTIVTFQNFIYPTMDDQRRLTLDIDMRYNKASVTHPTDGLPGTRESSYAWFNFDQYESTFRNFDTFKATDDPEFLAVYIRVSKFKRDLSVTYKTFDEFISDVSGNWAICLLLGVILHHVLRQIRCASLLRNVLLSRKWTMSDWYIQYQGDDNGVCQNCGKLQRQHDQGKYCDDAEDGRTIYIMSSDDPTTDSRKLNADPIYGRCAECGKTELEHWSVDGVLWCDQPVSRKGSNFDKITVGRMATIYDIPSELYALEQKEVEDHNQIEALMAKVRALEKHCGIDFGDSTLTNEVISPAPQLLSPRKSLRSHKLPRPPSSLAPISKADVVAELGVVDVETRGNCGGCGKPVFLHELRYVEAGRYFHQV